MQRIFERCHQVIIGACAHTALLPEFLGALTANESGGSPQAARFEPAVYRHLREVAEGKGRVFSGISARELDTELEQMLHPKAGSYHERYFGAPFAEKHTAEISAFEDEALRELATSWGYTQIMGYHMVGRDGSVRDLLEGQFHFRMAVELLSDFAHEFELDPAVEFEPMLRCWNTGRPYGETFDPDYVRKGLERMELYKLCDRAIE